MFPREKCHNSTILITNLPWFQESDDEKTNMEKTDLGYVITVDDLLQDEKKDKSEDSATTGSDTATSTDGQDKMGSVTTTSTEGQDNPSYVNSETVTKL